MREEGECVNDKNVLSLQDFAAALGKILYDECVEPDSLAAMSERRKYVNATTDASSLVEKYVVVLYTGGTIGMRSIRKDGDEGEEEIEIVAETRCFYCSLRASA